MRYKEFREIIDNFESICKNNNIYTDDIRVLVKSNTDVFNIEHIDFTIESNLPETANIAIGFKIILPGGR